MSELTRSIQVLGLGHELQGPKFTGFVDRSPMVASLMQFGTSGSVNS